MNKDSNDRLSRVRLLENLNSEAIASLEKRSRWRRYARDEQILDRDSDSRDVFLVVEGSVEVVNYSISGREVAFGHVAAGGYFGELSAIDGGQRSANIVAIESSLVLIVPPEVFTEILTHNPPAAMQVLRRLAQIHYHRGNLLFVEGDREGCLGEQEKALEFAHAADAPEWQAHALSGLGDAYYTHGKIATAHEYFNKSIELCRPLGMGALETANRNMILRAWIYRNEWDAAADECRSVCEAAEQTGNRRIEMFARFALDWTYTETADFDAALNSLDTTLELARDLKVKRTEAIALFYLARCRYFLGEREFAADLAGEAVQICHETGMGFCGPGTLGMLALASVSDEERNAALAEAETILEKGCLGHNFYWFHRGAMESYLERRDWDGVGRHAEALA